MMPRLALPGVGGVLGFLLGCHRRAGSGSVLREPRYIRRHEAVPSRKIVNDKFKRAGHIVSQVIGGSYQQKFGVFCDALMDDSIFGARFSHCLRGAMDSINRVYGCPKSNTGIIRHGEKSFCFLQGDVLPIDNEKRYTELRDDTTYSTSICKDTEEYRKLH